MTESITAEDVELNEENDLDKILIYALDEAAEKLSQVGELEPFTIILHGGNMHIETHPGETVEECFDSAAKAVRTLAHVMDAYIFAYDGYVETDTGTSDAIIAERGRPGEETAEAFAVLYTLDEEGEGTLTIEEGIYDLGEAESLLNDWDDEGEDADEDRAEDEDEDVDEGLEEDLDEAADEDSDDEEDFDADSDEDSAPEER